MAEEFEACYAIAERDQDAEAAQECLFNLTLELGGIADEVKEFLKSQLELEQQGLYNTVASNSKTQLLAVEVVGEYNTYEVCVDAALDLLGHKERNETYRKCVDTLILKFNNIRRRYENLTKPGWPSYTAPITEIRQNATRIKTSRKNTITRHFRRANWMLFRRQ